MLDYLGIERDRTRVEWVSAAEGAKFAATMNDFAKTITELGENKRVGGSADARNAKTYPGSRRAADWPRAQWQPRARLERRGEFSDWTPARV